MKNKYPVILLLALFLNSLAPVQAKKKEPETDSTALLLALLDSMSHKYKFDTGRVDLGENTAELIVPARYKFLDKTQARDVLENLWGNPPDESVLGMIFPADRFPLDSNAWAFVITFDAMGFVKDEDADVINYDDLLREMKTDQIEENERRKKDGYDPVEIIGWASKPYYDKLTKALHWAKELKFGDSEVNTLNYDLRLLGRRGVLSFNAVGAMDNMEEVKSSIEPIIASVKYKDGEKYSDFNPGVDKVAAFTIGGLVAGKVLAKVGFFAVIVKFSKFIILGIVGFFALIWKKFKGSGNNEPTSRGGRDLHSRK